MLPELQLKSTEEKKQLLHELTLAARRLVAAMANEAPVTYRQTILTLMATGASIAVTVETNAASVVLAVATLPDGQAIELFRIMPDLDATTKH
jgi:hypothetical protein